ncbi:MAG: tetratricopeptide repeat protein, partial [Caldilineaceae bacterium SB0664_bin_27]|nr:tetratricopeptide repeat protein [Caldilineaceae bacterium SB0664_bin_27]
MARVTAIFLSCVLLTASGLLASSVEETYQAALTQEKGEGNLKEAIRLYQQVIEAHEKGEGDEKMAARAQLRIGVCQEKLGLAQARQTYEAVRDKYPDQPQVGAEAARRLGSTHQREAVIEQPSHRTASESYIRRQLQQVMERAKQQKELTERQLEAIQRQTERQMEKLKQLTEPTKRRVEQTERSTSADSAFIGEQVRRQLEAAQQQMEQQMKQAERQMEALQRQLERQQKQLERQLETIQRQGFHFEWIRSPRSERIIRGSDQHYYHYAYTPPVIPYAYEEVAEVPVQWKFRLDESRYPQQQPTAYVTPDFDDSDWATIHIGQAWEDQGYEGHDEGAWYRARIKVDAEEGRPVLMAFGGVDKDAYVYVNGQWVGLHLVWDRPFILDISDQVVRDGENTVALFVYDGVNMGGVYGLINVHQPTDEVETDNFAVNRGGHLEMVEGGGWPVFKDHFASGKRYSRYAHRPPRIPYAYNKVAEVPVQWKFYPYPEEYQGDQDPILSSADFDDTDWADIDIGQAWEDQGYEGYDEGAWYRAWIEVDAEEGRPVHLAFGGVDNNAYVYVNGIFVGEHYGWNTPFILDISEAVKYKGQNAVAVRVYDGMNMGGIYGTI